TQDALQGGVRAMVVAQQHLVALAQGQGLRQLREETRDGRLVRIGQGGGRDLRRHDRLLGLCSAAARRPAFLAAFRASVVAAFAATLRTRLRPLTTLARPPATLTARPATVGTRPTRAGIASAARAFTTARLAMAGPLCRMPWALRI